MTPHPPAHTVATHTLVGKSSGDERAVHQEARRGHHSPSPRVPIAGAREANAAASADPKDRNCMSECEKTFFFCFFFLFLLFLLFFFAFFQLGLRHKRRAPALRHLLQPLPFRRGIRVAQRPQDVLENRVRREQGRRLLQQAESLGPTELLPLIHLARGTGGPWVFTGKTTRLSTS